MAISPQVSPVQRTWLDRMDISDPLTMQLDVFARAVRDMRRNEEKDFHPDWLEHYERLRARISNAVWEQPEYKGIIDFIDAIPAHDPQLKAIDPRSLRVAFLLGAGASAPEPSSIPTVRYLLPELLERARRLGREDLTRLADFCDARKISNIEDLLTAAQIASFCSRNTNVLELFNMLLYSRDAVAERDLARRRLGTVGAVTDTSSIAFLQDTFQLLFGLLSNLMLPARPNAAHEAIVRHTKAHPNTTIVTTNYDCCIDLALGKLGENYDYGIEFTNETKGAAKSSALTKLIKLHGSLNWYYCETCQNTHVVDFAKNLQSFLDNRIPFPVIAACAHCGGQRRGLLVPPLSMKFDVAPPLTPLMNDAREAFETADLVVAVGYSFADADVYITRMLSKSMQGSDSQRLLIVDPVASVVEKLKTRFKHSIPKFRTDRILYARDGCELFLPKFLAGELCDLSPPPARDQPATRQPRQNANRAPRKAA